MRAAKLAVLVAVAAFFALPTDLAAQEAPEAERYEDVTWYEVVHVDYKPGKADDAIDLIQEHFVPASEAAGNPGPVMELVHTTGPWDLTVIWELDEGPSAFTWKTAPENVAFIEALREQAGGQKAAQKIWKRYYSYVADSKVTLTRTPERP